MTSHVFNEYKRATIEREIDIAGDTIKAIPCMTNTTADVDYDADTVDDITTLDEMDGSGFTWGHGGTGRRTLTNVTVTETAGAPGVGHVTIDADDDTWAALGAGTRGVQGILLVKEVSGDSSNVPIAWLEFASPYVATGIDMDIAWNANGLFRVGV